MDTLLADPEIEIVVNLTVPAAHAPVSLQAIEAGKHVYLEKPLATRFAEAKPIMLAAATNGLRIGCAPDTLLWVQPTKRVAMRSMKVLSGFLLPVQAALLSHGMEDWHPNPAFYYHRGGGSIHDMGPYYVTQLVNLLGPVTCVTAVASTARKTRAITGGPLAGQLITVEVPTTVNGVLSFASGANVALEPFLGYLETQTPAARDLRQRRKHAGAGSQFLRRRAAGRKAQWRVGAARRQPACLWRTEPDHAYRCRTWLTIASSACSIWRRPSVAGGRIGSAAHLPCMCWKCSMHSNVRRSKAVTS